MTKNKEIARKIDLLFSQIDPNEDSLTSFTKINDEIFSDDSEMPKDAEICSFLKLGTQSLFQDIIKNAQERNKEITNE